MLEVSGTVGVTRDCHGGGGGLEWTVPLPDATGGSYFVSKLVYTGNKFQFSNPVHCKHTVRKWTMYLAHTCLVLSGPLYSTALSV